MAFTFDGQAFKLNLFDLRAVDVPISDDMLVCLDALRWGREDLHLLIPHGEQRVSDGDAPKAGNAVARVVSFTHRDRN